MPSERSHGRCKRHGLLFVLETGCRECRGLELLAITHGYTPDEVREALELRRLTEMGYSINPAIHVREGWGYRVWLITPAAAIHLDWLPTLSEAIAAAKQHQKGEGE